MTAVQLRAALGETDRTRALLNGRVTIPGCELAFVAAPPEQIFLDAFHDVAFDVAELSLSSFAMTVASGNPAYVGIPAFISRAFRHSAIYVAQNSGITRPGDLIGQAVGVPEYQVTAAVWVRAFLEEDHGVATRSIRWITGGVDTPGRMEKLALNLPPDINVTPAPTGETLSSMLLDGRIAALIAPRAPAGYAPRGIIRRMFSDDGRAARQYYTRHRHFPIMHIVGIRKALAEEHPELPLAVHRAFCESKAIGMRDLFDTTVAASMLPFLFEEVGRARMLIGDDVWSYGLNQNRLSIEHFLAAHHHQGLSSRQLEPTELFSPSTWKE